METCITSCPVCHEPRPLRETLFHHCGHFICSECYHEGTKAGTSSHKPKCYTCNVEIAHPPHRIYIDLEDLGQMPIEPPAKKIEIVEKLDAIDLDTPATSVKKVSGKVLQFCKREKNDPETLKGIHSALQRLETRTAPMFERSEEISLQNAELMEENRILRTSQLNHEENIKRAKRAVAKAKEESKQEHERAEKYHQMAIDHETRANKIQRTKDEEADAQKNQIGIQEKKIHALTKLLGKKRRSESGPSVDLDMSLEVEPPENIGMDTSSSRRRLKRKRGVLGEASNQMYRNTEEA